MSLEMLLFILALKLLQILFQTSQLEELRRSLRRVFLEYNDLTNDVGNLLFLDSTASSVSSAVLADLCPEVDLTEYCKYVCPMLPRGIKSLTWSTSASVTRSS